MEVQASQLIQTGKQLRQPLAGGHFISNVSRNLGLPTGDERWAEAAQDDPANGLGEPDEECGFPDNLWYVG